MSNKSSHWSNYWHTGHLTSLPQDFSSNYEGELKAFWFGVFSRIAKNGKILDVCTGNGAIAILASQYSESKQKNFEVTGIDAADINTKEIKSKYPEYSNYIQKISFEGNILLEEVQKTDSSLDLITSQYGIEYCNWSQSAAKVTNLLKVGGLLAFVCHGHKTAIMAYMREEESDYQLLDRENFFKIFQNFESKRINGNEFKTQLKSVFSTLGQRPAAKESPLIGSIANLVSQIINMEESILEHNRCKIEQFYKEHVYAFARLKDVVNISEQISQSPGWFKVFEDCGLSLLDSGNIMQDGQHNAGNYYIFEKQA